MSITMLHPTYVLRVEIQDKPDYASTIVSNDATPPMMAASSTPFTPLRKWFKDGQCGCDSLMADVRKALAAAHIDANVFLEKFEHKAQEVDANRWHNCWDCTVFLMSSMRPNSHLEMDAGLILLAIGATLATIILEIRKGR